MPVSRRKSTNSDKVVYPPRAAGVLGIGVLGSLVGACATAKRGYGGNGGERLEPCLRGRGRVALFGPLREPVQDAV